MNVMLLAAGEGTRLRPHTLFLPKPAIPFLTLPLVTYAISFLECQGQQKINTLVANTFHLPEQMEKTLRSMKHSAHRLMFSHETGEILGSGGGLKKVQAHFQDGGDFAMMNADEVILPQDPIIFQKALHRHQQNQTLATLLVMEHEGVGTKFGGVWTKGNQVLGFGKEPIPGSDKAWHFIGVQILNEKVFDFIPEEGANNILYDALTLAMAQGHSVQIFPIQCRWFETGNEKDFLAATSQCLDILSQESPEGAYLKNILATHGKSPLPLAPSSRSLVSAEARVSKNAHLEGFTVIGHGSEIGEGCRLKNVSIGDNVHLPALSHYEDQILLSLANS